MKFSQCGFGGLLIRSKHDSSLEQIYAVPYDVPFHREQKTFESLVRRNFRSNKSYRELYRFAHCKFGTFLQVQVGIGSEQVFRIVDAGIWWFLRHGDRDTDRFVHGKYLGIGRVWKQSFRAKRPTKT